MDLTDDKIRLLLLDMQSCAQLYGRDCRVVRGAFVYRRLRNIIWWNWRRWILSWLAKAPPKDDRLHVFWSLRGGLGDCAVARLAVLALREKLPHAVFYFHTVSPTAAKTLFEPDDKNIFLPPGEPLWYRYDLAIEICQTFKTVYCARNRVAAVTPELLPLLDKMTERQRTVSFFLEDNYLLEDLMGSFAVKNKFPRAALLSYLSGLDFDPLAAPPLPDSLICLDRLEHFGLRDKKYITFHDGIDSTFILKGKRPLKCWPSENWREWARLFKKRFPHILLVQLGGKNSPIYDFADISLVGKTQLEDLPALLNGALLHVDGESGLVQLARYLAVQSVVLFGPTDKQYFGIKKNINLKENLCGCCMWLLGTQWHTCCALGHKTCRNMEALTPQKVFSAVEEALEEKLK